MHRTKDNPTPGDEWVIPPQEPEAPASPARRHATAKLFALVAASIVVGAGATYAANHAGDSTARADTGNAPAAVARGNGVSSVSAVGRIAREQHVPGSVTGQPDGEDDSDGEAN